MVPRALYYALDVHPRTVFQLRRSVESVRRHTQALPMYAAVSGALDTVDRTFLENRAVTVLNNGSAKVGPTYLKWYALRHDLPAEQLLYFDTDTFASGDPSQLFEAGADDFHARLEVGSERDPGAYPYRLNAQLVTRSQLDHELFDWICRAIGARALPIFNTGVMLFRNGVARRVSSRWPDFVRLDRAFRRKRLPYPCRNAHILEQVVATLVLGTIDDLSWASLPRHACPSYQEYRGGHVTSPGIVLHTWSACYAACLFERDGADAAGAYTTLPPHDDARWAVTSRLLRLGSTLWRLPNPVLERWVTIANLPNLEARGGRKD